MHPISGFQPDGNYVHLIPRGVTPGWARQGFQPWLIKANMVPRILIALIVFIFWVSFLSPITLNGLLSYLNLANFQNTKQAGSLTYPNLWQRHRKKNAIQEQKAGSLQ